VLTFIPDIAEEHYEELQFLWSQRRNALRSPAYTLRELGMLEERIEAHVQGLLVIGEENVYTFVDKGLTGEDEMAAFAAAYALLRLGTPTALAKVLDAFRDAKGKQLDGIREALAFGAAQPLQQQLTTLFLSGPLPVAVAAGEALVLQNAVRPAYEHVARFLTAEDPNVRAAAWRIVANAVITVPADLYERALRDDDPAVKSAALAAAAWTAYPGFAAYCRNVAATPTLEGLEPLLTLACVAPPQEFQTIATLAATPALGRARLKIAGAFGHPAFMDFVLQEMENADPGVAASAGDAFEKMTGLAVYSDKRATIPPAGGPPKDEVEAEFQEEVSLPDVPLARKHWESVKPHLSGAARIGRGFDLSQAIARETFAALDMESRWELCLRARLTAGWTGTPVSLQTFPQRA
jgi:uncharacterized protein (TIGR02270 family)